VQALAQRVLVDQRIELGDDFAVTAGGKVFLDRQLGGARAELLQAPDLGRCERLVSDIGERLTAPQRQRLARPRALDQTLNAKHVDLAVEQSQLVASVAGDDLRAVAVEQLAQLRDVELDQLGGTGRRSLAPQTLDQAVGRHCAPDLEREHREDRALLARSDRNRPVVEAHLDRPKQEQIHAERRSRTIAHRAYWRSDGE
jgi:hypothetical protein